MLSRKLMCISLASHYPRSMLFARTRLRKDLRRSDTRAAHRGKALKTSTYTRSWWSKKKNSIGWWPTSSHLAFCNGKYANHARAAMNKRFCNFHQACSTSLRSGWSRRKIYVLAINSFQNIFFSERQFSWVRMCRIWLWQVQLCHEWWPFARNRLWVCVFMSAIHFERDKMPHIKHSFCAERMAHEYRSDNGSQKTFSVTSREMTNCYYSIHSTNYNFPGCRAYWMNSIVPAAAFVFISECR